MIRGVARRFARRRWITPQRLRRSILITGCGSSGTTWVAALLRHNRIDVTHDESLGSDGIVTNACNHRHVSVFDLGDVALHDHVMMTVPIRYFAHRIHLVRDPRRTIGSVIQKWRGYGDIWPQIRADVDGLDLDDPFSFANGMRYWVAWNEMCESITSHRFRVEDLTVNPEPLFGAIGRDFRRSLVTKGVASSGVPGYPSWDDLAMVDESLARRTRDLAARYGYDEP